MNARYAYQNIYDDETQGQRYLVFSSKDLIAAAVRLVVQLIIFLIYIHPWAKVFLILLTEGVDSMMLNMMGSREFSDSIAYNYHDKINDLIGFVLVIAVTYQSQLLPYWVIAVLIATTLFRSWQIPAYHIFGTIDNDDKHIYDKNRDWSFAVFPDVFKEIIAAYLIITFLSSGLSQNLFFMATIFSIIFAAKTWYEYAYHVRRLFGH